MLELLKKPYDLLEHKKFRRLLLFGMPVFIFLFLLFFEPFDLSSLKFIIRVKALLIYFTGIIPVFLVNHYFVSKYFLKKYTIGSTVLRITWSIFLISVAMFIINVYLFNDGRFILEISYLL